jgi:hypothetical protein
MANAATKPLNHHRLLIRIHGVSLRQAGMTGAEVGKFLGSRFNERCGVRSVRSNPGATTVDYHEAD